MNIVLLIHNFVKKHINNIEKIYINNYMNYVPERSSNGGNYAFYTTITKQDNKWIVEYDTSSDIAFCDILGIFQECYRCMYYDREEGECLENYTTYATEELLDKIIIEIKQYHRFIESAKITSIIKETNDELVFRINDRTDIEIYIKDKKLYIELS